MKLAVISFTDRGGRLGEDLVRRLEAGGHVCGFCRMRRGRGILKGLDRPDVPGDGRP